MTLSTVLASSVAGYFAGPLLVDLVVDLKFGGDSLAAKLARPIAHSQYDFIASIAVSVGGFLLLGVVL